MPKFTSNSQQIGKNAVKLLNRKLSTDDFDVNFDFVETPQQHDYGLDGYLNIFKNNKIQDILVFAQVKGILNPNSKLTK